MGILAAWLASLVQLVPANPTLDAIAYVVIGVIFGTGAGAAVVSNGAAHRADIANVRLDSIAAPQAATAQAMVTANGQAQADAGGAAATSAAERTADNTERIAENTDPNA
jgi:hypothetical protein